MLKRLPMGFMKLLWCAFVAREVNVSSWIGGISLVYSSFLRESGSFIVISIEHKRVQNVQILCWSQSTKQVTWCRLFIKAFSWTNSFKICFVRYHMPPFLSNDHRVKYVYFFSFIRSIDIWFLDWIDK